MRAVSSGEDPQGGVISTLAPGVALTNAPAPVVTPGQALLAVTAAGINRADALQLHGAYPPPPGVANIPGLEVAGTVLSAEPTLRQHTSLDVAYAMHTHQQVLALLPGGGLADLVAADMSLLLPVPSVTRALSVQPATPHSPTLTLQPLACSESVRAVALVEACATAWLNLKILGDIQPGQRVLIHGGSGAIGTIAIQLAAHLGAEVYTSAGSPERAALTRQLGAEHAVDYHDDLVAAITEATRGEGVDLILDVTGAGGLETNLKLLAPAGTLLLMGLQRGVAGTINLNTVMTKRLTLTGATLRSAPPALRARVIDDLIRHVWPMVEAEQILPVIDHVYPLDKCGDAFARLAPKWFGDPVGTYACTRPFGKMVAEI
ncbi:zinc-binding dehydrogenase [Nanchangia anserum]|uniref:Zinc-binding dehydrogenase n=1 Tax=Nanchangia anserum TaxID=2692125 RepID=A0A8I0GCF9_9ACTO|nr:zinc-binding dehydrogenase [Nanchangia anserum]MBD3689456.1 zinc-binding dehydrogenase [Nanchangia anserum]QOX81655.1 zinc-binding dehydrogenase [Nanchangia anserum]